jgi:hypothetical protein
LVVREGRSMEDKTYVVCQGDWILTSVLSLAKAECEMARLSEWFSGLAIANIRELQVQQIEQNQG